MVASRGEMNQLDEPALPLDLETLYRAEADFVRRVVARLAGPVGDVDDLIQEVFLIAHRRAATFAGRASPRTWLYGISVRVVAGWRRRRKLRRFFGLDRAPEPADRSSPAELFEYQEQAEAFYRILDGMSEKKRAVFLLYEAEGLSGEEIAEALACPLKTVWTRLFHARRELMGALGREEAR